MQMAKRGPKNTPTALRLLRGNPQKRRMPQNEPDGVGDLWDPPTYFDAIQKREWLRVVESAPWLTGTDRDLVASYCVAVVEFARAVKAVRKNGQTETTNLAGR
jgi:phage terminase small subunit